MLVLSRKCGEQIVLPSSGVVLTVLEIHGQTIRLGVTAPREIRIMRAEVLERTETVPVQEGSSCQAP